jgi:TPR repeat protein
MTESVKWYLKSAEQGYAEAQHNLGICYDEGAGVVKNETIAYKWLLLSAAKGNEFHKKNMVITEKRLTPKQRAEGQRLATEWQDEFKRNQKTK